MHRVALDAMGGDFAPSETVAGAVQAVADGVDLTLVGDEPVIRSYLDGADVPITHASETIGMGDDVASAIREKTESSISVCARMVREGSAGALVSAGSTGAAMAAAALIIGRSPKVLRPTIATLFPTPGSPTIVLDSGANPEVKAEHLLQFAAMGEVLAESLYQLDQPRIGLLSNGEEKGKGRALEREAYELLAASKLNFIGNVEGRDLVTDRADVFVTDGFSGNIFLKTAEGVAAMMAAMALEEFGDLTPEAAAEVMPRFGRIRGRLDSEQTGGAYLLGVQGVVIIAHGSSSRVAIANAVKMASDSAEHDLPARVAARISEL